MVSATVALDMPERLTMSPASALSTAVRLRPRKASTRETRKRSISAPSRDRACTIWPVLTVPCSMRPVSSRPRNGSAARVVASMAKGSPLRAAWAGGGTWSRMSW